MKKVVLTFGLMAGFLVTFMMLGGFALQQGDSGFKHSEVVGYTTMIVSLSMVFFGIRSYRDNYQKGQISFGKAFQVGMLITLIASAMYVTGWMIYSEVKGPAMMNEFFQENINQVKSSGLPAAEIDAKVKEMEYYREIYKNPLVKIGFTLLEIFPVGLLITLLSAAILKRKTPTREAVLV